MTRRKKRSRRNSEQPSFVKEERSEYQLGLPPFASSASEIEIAVEQNAIDRGILLIQIIASLKIDELLKAVDELANSYDKEAFYEVATDIGIKTDALLRLDQADPPLPYPYYFCMPNTLAEQPQLVFYYRNVAMLSRKVMRGIQLDTEAYEELGTKPPPEAAYQLARYFNAITSDLILQSSTIPPHRHIVMLSANLGDSLGGTSRNEVGRVALMRVIHPIIRHLYSNGWLFRICRTLKGDILEKEESDSGTGKREWIEIDSQVDIDALLKEFEKSRVLYHELETINGSRLLLNRQLEWEDESGEVYRVGPDLHSHVGTTDMLWAAELKGGADPAGSDEHWKTATQALERIIQAAQATKREQPALSFIATILVERVAFEAQDWIDQGKLTSVYNLTQMYHQKAEMNRFLNDITGFLGYSTTDNS